MEDLEVRSLEESQHRTFSLDKILLVVFILNLLVFVMFLLFFASLLITANLHF